MKEEKVMLAMLNHIMGGKRHVCWKLKYPTRFKAPRHNWKRNEPNLGLLIRAFGTARIDCATLVPATCCASSSVVSVGNKEVSHNG